MNITIRKINSAELGALIALYEHLHEVDDLVPSDEILISNWNEIMASDRYNYFGVFLESQLISSCSLTIIPNLTRGCRPYGIIENVVTHPSHRKKGYGSSLLRAALCHAYEVGCYKVMMLTGKKDDATFRFYEGVGFDRHEKQGFIAKLSINK